MAEQLTDDTVVIPPGKLQDEGQDQNVNETSQNPSLEQSSISIVAEKPSFIEEDSDSDDEEHALERSLMKIKVNSVFNKSSHGLTSILSEESAQIRYPQFQISKLMNQKRQMNDLNVILREYMTANKDLDDDINNIAEQIKDAKVNRQNEENKINGYITDIAKQKKDQKDMAEDLKRVTCEEKVIDMKNKNLERECKRTELEIEAIKLRIANLNRELEDLDDDINNDKNEITNELEPEAEKLKQVSEEVTKQVRSDIVDLLTKRKQQFLQPYNIEFATKKQAENPEDLKALLERYRKECIRVKSTEIPQDLLDLQKEVAQREFIEKELIDQIKNLTETHEGLNKTLINITYQINVTETNITTITRQIEDNNNHYENELHKLQALLDLLNDTNIELNQDYDEAYDYLLQVLLKDFGKKDRIEQELKEMGIMLDWGKIKKMKNAKEMNENAEKPPQKESGPVPGQTMRPASGSSQRKNGSSKRKSRR